MKKHLLLILISALGLTSCETLTPQEKSALFNIGVGIAARQVVHATK